MSLKFLWKRDNISFNVIVGYCLIVFIIKLTCVCLTLYDFSFLDLFSISSVSINLFNHLNKLDFEHLKILHALLKLGS